MGLFLCGRYGFEVSSVSRRIFEVDLCWGDGYLKAWLRDGFGVDGGYEWVVSECESGVFFRISGDFDGFYNCLIIYCM